MMVMIYRILWSALRLDAATKVGLVDVITLEDHKSALADAQATVEALQREVNTLNQLLRDKGLGQGEIDGMAAEHDELQALRDERDLLRANLVNCVARLEAYYGEDYPAVRDAKAALTPAGGQD